MVRWLVLAYPRAWRERYGEEFAVMLAAEPASTRLIMDILFAALRERIAPSVGEFSWAARPASLRTLSMQPSAFVPMGMSVAALATVLTSLAISGSPRPGSDEGATAHIWQLLMTFQVPVILWFSVKWLRTAPWLAVGVLAIQITLALMAAAPVYVLGL